MRTKAILILALTLSLLMIPSIRAAPKPGDINDDGNVDMLDVVLAAGQYKLTPLDAGYNATIVGKADFTGGDGIVTLLDMVTLVGYYGT